MLRSWIILLLPVVTIVPTSADEGQPTAQSPYNAGSDKQLFIDDALIARTHRVKLVVNRPTPTGEKCIVVDKPWEQLLNAFGDSVVQDGDIIRMYNPTFTTDGRFVLCCALSRDGIHWEKPELDIVHYEGQKTNIIYPDASLPAALDPRYFFGTCVFTDRNPNCPPEQRYKMINGDSGTWAFASPDGVHFTPMFSKPSFRPADTNNLCFFDDRIGRYVAYVRSFAPLRAVGRCEFDDLSDFGPDTIVFAADDQDNNSFDKTRFAEMDFYNSSAIKYPYAANAYFMYPSAFYHFHENTFDGPVNIQFASSRDGIKWTRLDRAPFVPLEGEQRSLYMATGLVRQGERLYLYYGVYYNTHGAPADPRNHITRAELRLDGFVSVDAAEREGRITTVPVTFSGGRLELNVQGEQIKVGLLDERGRPIPGFSLRDCDAISGDHIAKTVSWRGQSGVGRFAAETVQLAFTLRNAKLYAFQFVR